MKHLERETLVDYRIDNLSADRRTTCEEHLAVCEHCREALQNLDQLVGALEDIPSERAPADLEEHVFALVDHDRTVRLLKDAPLAPTPDADLESRTLAQIEGDTTGAALLRQKPTGYSRNVVRSLVGVAAILLAGLAFTTFKIADLNEELDRKNGNAPPPGHLVQTIALGKTEGDVGLRLIHFRHNNYRLRLYTDHFPVQRQGHHYEVWLEGSGGQALAGSFRITHPDEVTLEFNIGVDPALHNHITILEEADDGDLSRDGRVVAKGTLDPDHVDH
ncbi:MAG: hypothetical protein M3285_04065 [Actinomycetota bacterium]|nr:hypothetical protein [Actinomycetota bacterium]